MKLVLAKETVRALKVRSSVRTGNKPVNGSNRNDLNGESLVRTRCDIDTGCTTGLGAAAGGSSHHIAPSQSCQ